MTLIQIDNKTGMVTGVNKAIELQSATNDKGREVLVSRKWVDDTRTGRDGNPMNITSYKLITCPSGFPPYFFGITIAEK